MDGMPLIISFLTALLMTGGCWIAFKNGERAVEDCRKFLNASPRAQMLILKRNDFLEVRDEVLKKIKK